MDTDRSYLLTDQGAPDLLPLRNSHEADQLETELKGLFLTLFAQFVRPALDSVETVGMPHWGDVDQLERAIKTDGIAIQRSTDLDAMRYLHKAFRARNPKRGLHMLRAYLQVMFGDGNWVMDQLWQDAALPYPTSLHEEAAADRYLTSRVHVSVVSSGIAKSPELMAQAFRSVLPARMLLTVNLFAYPFESNVRVFMAGMALAEVANFIGDFIEPPFRLGSLINGAAFQAATASAERMRFTGNFQ